MAALNVSPTQVRQALAANNYLSAIGQTKGTFLQLNLSATTGIESVEDFRRLVIRQEGGTLVRLGDVADVVLGADNYEMDVRMSGARAIFMGVWVLPNATRSTSKAGARGAGQGPERAPHGAQRHDRLRRHQSTSTAPSTRCAGR